MEELKAGLLPCNLEQLNDRINNLSAGLTAMREKDTIQVNKAFLETVLDYMEELLGMRRREEEVRRVAPENKALTVEQLRGMVGDPVWIVTTTKGHESARWRVLEKVKKEIEGEFFHFGNAEKDGVEYGRTWLAYARRPEAAP